MYRSNVSSTRGVNFIAFEWNVAKNANVAGNIT